MLLKVFPSPLKKHGHCRAIFYDRKKGAVKAVIDFLLLALLCFRPSAPDWEQFNMLMFALLRIRGRRRERNMFVSLIWPLKLPAS